jgi:WD40 repeat protein
MKAVDLLVVFVIGIALMPAVKALPMRNKNLAGNEIRQDTGQKKASLANPLLELEIKLESGVTAIAFSPDNKTLAIGAHDYTIQLRDAKTGREELQLLEPDRGVRPPGVHPDGQKVSTLAFSPDGKTLASAGDIIKNNLLAGGQVTIWEMPSGKLLRRITVNSEIAIYTKSVAFTPDGKRLVTGMAQSNGKGEISEWDALTGELKRKWRPNTGIHSVTFSPDGQFLVAGCSDATIKFWDFNSGEYQGLLRRPISRVFSLSISPDGNTLASCVGPYLPGIAGNLEQLSKVHLLDRQTGQFSMMNVSHRYLVTAVAFSPDGEHLASGDEGLYSLSSHRHENGTVNIWRIK